PTRRPPDLCSGFPGEQAGRGFVRLEQLLCDLAEAGTTAPLHPDQRMAEQALGPAEQAPCVPVRQALRGDRALERAGAGDRPQQGEYARIELVPTGLPARDQT